MAKRYGGKFSPDQNADAQTTHIERIEVHPVGGRANILFLPAFALVLTSFGNGAVGLTVALIGAGLWTLAAWLLRDGLQAEAAYNARKVARRPALPRKMLSSALTAFGTACAVFSHSETGGLIAPILLGLCAGGLHVAAFGIDPLKSKGMEGIDTFQQDRVAVVVDEAEKMLTAMSDAIKRAGDRTAEARLSQFQTTARKLIRTVEEDPRDLTAARKYLSVYLRGARDATAKFADFYAQNRDVQARDDYLALLEDLDQNFAARQQKSLLEDRGDLTVEIDVLRERLSREGVRLD